MNDKVFVKESYKILKGTAVFKDGSIDEIKNVQVYSKINVDPWVEELKNEIERLKGEVRKWKRDSAITSAMFRLVVQGKECTSTKVLEEAERVENLEKENAKLKCLALHLFWKYAERLMWKCDGMSQLSTKPYTKDYWSRKCIRWEEVRNKFYKAYRKAKKALREGRNEM